MASDTDLGLIFVQIKITFQTMSTQVSGLITNGVVRATAFISTKIITLDNGRTTKDTAKDTISIVKVINTWVVL